MNKDVKQIAQNFYDHIMELAKRRGFDTYTELAEKAGIHHSTISQYKRGERKPSISTMRKIAQALEVDLEVVEKGLKPPGNTPHSPGNGDYQITVICAAGEVTKVVSLLTKAGLSANINIEPIEHD